MISLDGEVGRRVFQIWDKTQLIACLLQVRKARTFIKKKEPRERSPVRRCREAMQKELDHSSLAPILRESPCLQASTIQTLGTARKPTAGVTHEPGRMDKDPGSQHFITNTAT